MVPNRPDPVVSVEHNGSRTAHTCFLMGIGHGQLHVRSDKWMEPAVHVTARFEHVAIKGVILYCNHKSDGYVTCISVKAEDEPNRREHRFPVNQPASISLLGDRGTFRLKGSVTDISRSGLGLKVSQPADVGCMICVEMESMVVAGEVRHCRKNSEDGLYRMGIEITDILLDSGERRGLSGKLEAIRWRLAEAIVGRPLRIGRPH